MGTETAAGYLGTDGDIWAERGRAGRVLIPSEVVGQSVRGDCQCLFRVYHVLTPNGTE